MPEGRHEASATQPSHSVTDPNLSAIAMPRTVDVGQYGATRDAALGRGRSVARSGSTWSTSTPRSAVAPTPSYSRPGSGSWTSRSSLRAGDRRARRADRGRPGRARHRGSERFGAAPASRPWLDPGRRRPLGDHRPAGPGRLRPLHRHRRGISAIGDLIVLAAAGANLEGSIVGKAL